MKRLTSICLFFVVIAAGLWPNEQPKWMILLTSLRSERQAIELSLNSIENELSTTKQALSDLKAEFLQMQTASDEQRNLWNESKKAVEEQGRELEQERALLIEQRAMSAQREKQLTESEGSLTSLKQNFGDYQAEAESEIQALEVWRGVALIGIPVALILGGILGAILF